jgi:hypothetical protein
VNCRQQQQISMGKGFNHLHLLGGVSIFSFISPRKLNEDLIAE